MLQEIGLMHYLPQGCLMPGNVVEQDNNLKGTELKNCTLVFEQLQES